MLALEWAELDVVVADIRHLQNRLATARLTGDEKLAQIFSEELNRALTERDSLVYRIGAGIGGGETPEPLKLAA